MRVFIHQIPETARRFRSVFMGNRQVILEQLVSLGNGIEQNLASLQSLLEQHENCDSELRLVREIQQDFMLRRALLRKLQERLGRFGSPELIDKIFNSLEE
jgi:hypothetical protein